MDTSTNVDEQSIKKQPLLESNLQLLYRQITSPEAGKFMSNVIIINLIILLIRPQDVIPVVGPIIGNAKLLVICSLVPAIAITFPRLLEVWHLSNITKVCSVFW